MEYPPGPAEVEMHGLYESVLECYIAQEQGALQALPTLNFPMMFKESTRLNMRIYY